MSDHDSELDVIASVGNAESTSAAPIREIHGWRQVRITVDSGAADFVADPEPHPLYEVKRRGRPVFHQSASGEPQLLQARLQEE